MGVEEPQTRVGYGYTKQPWCPTIFHSRLFCILALFHILHGSTSFFRSVASWLFADQVRTHRSGGPAPPSFDELSQQWAHNGEMLLSLTLP